MIKKWIVYVVMIGWGGAVVAGPVQVAVTIAPLAALVQQIGGSHVVVTSLVPPGASPHVFEPKPSAVRALRSAQLIVTIPNIGLNIAEIRSLNRMVPEAKILDLTVGEVLLGDGHAHGHGGDPHIWLSPVIMGRQTQRIAAALSEIDPKNRLVYRTNASQIESKFKRMIAAYKPRIQKMDLAIIAVHPSLTYLSQDLGFVELSVETHGRAPSAKVLSGLVSQAKRHPYRAVLVQPQYAQSALRPISTQLNAVPIKMDVYSTRYPENIESFLGQISKLTPVK